MPFNGPMRELDQPLDLDDEVVYCTQCGSIFVKCTISRSCPACTLDERQQKILEQIDRLDQSVRGT